MQPASLSPTPLGSSSSSPFHLHFQLCHIPERCHLPAVPPSPGSPAALLLSLCPWSCCAALDGPGCSWALGGSQLWGQQGELRGCCGGCGGAQMTHTPSSPSLFPAGALKPQLSDSPGTNCSISRAGAWPPPSAAHTDPAGATQLWRAARAPANYALLCWEAALPGTVPHGCSPAGPHCPDLVPATRSLTAGWGGAALRSWGGPQIAPMTPTARHGAAPRCRPRGCVQSELQWVRWGPESPTLPWSGGPCSWQPPTAGSPPPAALVNVKASGRHCAQPCLPAASSLQPLCSGPPVVLLRFPKWDLPSLRG